MPKYAIFGTFFTINLKDILYITLKVQAEQNVSIQNDLTWNFFFTINGPAKA